jgi:hypothetical protein
MYFLDVCGVTCRQWKSILGWMADRHSLSNEVKRLATSVRIIIIHSLVMRSTPTRTTPSSQQHNMQRQHAFAHV